MKISEQSKAPLHLGEGVLAHSPADNIAAKDTLSAPAIVASAFGKFDIALRARLLSRLLGSVGPLALAVDRAAIKKDPKLVVQQCANYSMVHDRGRARRWVSLSDCLSFRIIPEPTLAEATR